MLKDTTRMADDTGGMPEHIGDSKTCLLTPTEYEAIIYDYNRTDTPYPHATIHALFERQAKAAPDQTALVFEGQTLSYRALDERANQLARYLRRTHAQTRGAALEPDSLIALYVDRSFEMLVAMLGILKADAAYVPIDTEYPAERLAFILEDTGAPFILTQAGHVSHLESVIGQHGLDTALVDLEEDSWRQEPSGPLEPTAAPDNLAYVIYTSGTTGKPKGVMVEHAGVVNRITWMQARYPLQSGDRVLQKTPYSFDVSVWELFWANFYGATLVIAKPNAHKDPEALCDIINEQEIGTLHFVPSMFVSFLEYLESRQARTPSSVRQIFTSGEALGKQSVEQFYRLRGAGSAQLHNLYGPTETSIDSTYFDCSTPHAVVPIGRPIANTRLYILDPHLNPVPRGVIGELYIGGAGVARGYLNRPELTEERFIPNPFATPEDREKGYTRLYKSGDLVRLLEDGNIEYLGRNDFQVKIRGLRIELGEIENALSGHESIAQAVVVVHEHRGRKQLVGYYRATSPVKEEALRAYLQQRLPDYMTPAILMKVDAFKLTLNGKLDRQALPEPVIATTRYTAPANELEAQLCSIVEEILDLERVSVEDDFFRIGGDSITAMHLKYRLQRQGLHCSAQMLMQHRTPRALARQLHDAPAQDTAIDLTDIRLNPMQRLIVNHQLSAHPLLYNEHITIDFKNDPIDPARLNRALIRFIAHHPLLRVTVDKDYERFIPDKTPSHDAQVLQIIDVDTTRAYFEQLKRTIDTAIDLHAGPLYRFILFRVNAETYKLLFLVHHVVSDADSMYNLFVPELHALLQDENAVLSKAPTQLSAPRWREDLRDLIENMAPVELFGARRSDETDGCSAVYYISQEQARRLQAIAQQHGVSLYALLLSSLFLLLHKCSHQTRLTVGGVTSLRSCLTEPVYGNFLANDITTIALDTSWTFPELMEAVFHTVQSNLDTLLPYDKLLETIRESYVPDEKLPNVFMTLEPKRTDQAPWSVTQNETLPSHVKYDLYFEFDLQEQLELRIEYRTQSYTSRQIEQIGHAFTHLLSRITEEPDLPLRGLSLLTASEHTALIYDYNRTDTSHCDATIHALFAEQARAAPQQIALAFEEQTLTYQALEERANQLARFLRTAYEQTHGTPLEADSLIGLYADRSLEMMIGMLAILKTGAAYVPLDPEYPEQRLAFMLEDTRAAFLLTDAGHASHLEGVMERHGLSIPLIDLQNASWRQESSDPLESPAGPAHLAYVIYTSGTTGKPKGVMVEHQAVVSLVRETNYVEITPEDGFVQLSSPVFDAATFEIWGALLNGAKLVVPRQAQELLADTVRLKAFLTQQGVSILWLTKTLFDTLYLSDASLFASLRYLLVGGEALDAGVIKDCLAQPDRPTRLLNGYGPTEATTFTTTFDCDRPFCCGVPIGQPIHGRKTYILDPLLNPVPQGVIGELYIGGAGVARGYLNRPELTEERFIPNPFATPEDQAKGYTRLYKTGDLVRLLEDSNIEFMGRNDFQVKIRGFRIELGEIENALRGHESIAQAVVVVHEHQGHKQLVGYYRATAPIEEETLRAYLQQRLPDYMTPAILMPVDAFKVTLNGKLDRQALPEPVVTSTSRYTAPATEFEQQLCAIVEEILDLERVGVEDDFFRIGGDSILSIQLSSRLKKAGLHVSVKDIFTYKTIRRLCAGAVSQGGESVPQAEQEILEGTLELLPIQHWFFDQLDAGWLPEFNHWNQSFMIAVPPLEATRLPAALDTLCEHHDMLRAVFGCRDGEGYQQHYRRVLKAPTLHQLDASGLSEAEIDATLTQWQSGFSIFNESDEPLWSAGYLHHVGADRRCYLFFAAHHLIIDAVSWRIIVEDLRALYEGEALGAKTASYRAWVQSLRRYAESHAVEQRSWKALFDHAGSYPAPQSASHDHHVRLSADLTQSLLQQANQAYHTGINDLLLSALSEALHDLSGDKTHLITLEGHGREPIDARIDTSRTIGWFTTMYPVRLDYAEDRSWLIRRTKESLAAIPDKGVGYGAVRHLMEESELSAAPLPPVSFNYLGVLNSERGEDSWRLADASSGTPVGLANEDHGLISLNGMVMDGELQFQIRTRLGPDASARFSACFQSALEQTIAHCVGQVAQGQRRHTPSDFHLPVSLELFDRLDEDSIEAIYPATSLQQGFIYHALTHSRDDAYRVQILIDYPHPIHIAQYREAWELAIATYPILRTSFNWEEEPLQLIHKEGRLNFTLHDCSDAEDIDAAIRGIQQADRDLAFDLSEPTLLRLHLIARPDGGYTLLKSEHHSIADGWSVPILLEKVHAFYAALLEGESVETSTEQAYLEVQRYYADHAGSCHAYWREQIARMEQANDLNPMLSRPTDLERARTIEKPRELTVTLESEPLRRAISRHGVTLNTLVQFAWHKLISVYTGDSQTIVGTTVSGRAIPVDGIEQSVGLYINTLPLIIHWEGEATILAQLEQIAQRIAEMNNYAFEPLASLQPEGKRAFHSLFVYENYPVAKTSPDAPLQPVLREAIEKVDYPLSLIVHEQDGQLHITLSYDALLLDEAEARKLGQRLRALLEQTPAKLDQPHTALTLLSPAERQELIYDYNRTDTPYPHTTIHALFEQQAQAAPDHTALVFEGQTLSYRELDERANQLARYLRRTYEQTHRAALEPDRLIALYVDRSFEMLIAMLGILKAGAAYVPIDTDYPAERLAFILEDTRAPFLLTQAGHVSHLERVIADHGLESVLVDLEEDSWRQEPSGPLEPTAAQDNLAYVIYTSGTTGKPKGVMVEHAGVVSLVAETDYIEITKEDGFLQLSSPVFDAATFEIWGALLNGAKLVVPGDAQEIRADAARFRELLRQNDITILLVVKTLFDTLYLRDPSLFESVRYCLSGGEALNPFTVNGCIQRARRPNYFLNVYGPTEATTFTTIFNCDQPFHASVPIGKPVCGRRTYILDSHLNPVPRGVIGELYIGGAGVARGYLNRPELTEERFISNPFATPEDQAKGYTRLYKSGDLVRLREDGNIEYLGRNDFQVKFHGFRIELGEIENALRGHESIAQAVVVVHEHQSHKQLVGYYRASAPIEEEALRAYLHERLPYYITPAVLMKVDEFRLTLNGKLDRKALPEPVVTSTSRYTAPATELEKRLCAIVEEILDLERVGVEDDLFRLGLNSLLSIRLIHHISRELNIQITFSDVMEHSNVQALAPLISALEDEEVAVESGEI